SASRHWWGSSSASTRRAAPPAWTRSRRCGTSSRAGESLRPERLVEIRQQVVRVLDPDGEAHQAVAHGSRILNQRGGTTEAAGEREDAGALGGVPRGAGVMGLEGDHAAEAAL